MEEGVLKLGNAICKHFAYLVLCAVLCCACTYINLLTHFPLVQTKLVKYKKANGNCNVPQGYTEDLSLGHWVNNQRTLYKYFKAGEYAQGMNNERIAKLEEIGFCWVRR